MYASKYDDYYTRVKGQCTCDSQVPSKNDLFVPSTHYRLCNAPNPFRRLCDSASGSVDVCLDGVDDTGGLFLIPDRVDWASRLSALTANVAGDVQRRIHVWKVGSFVRRRTRVVCAAAVVT